MSLLELEIVFLARDLFCVIYEWAKCGDDALSIVPTVLWAMGTAALAHRLLGALFRRFLFRRVPVWEVMLQHLLFIWIVIYSLHFWTLLVRLVKIVVEYLSEELSTPEDINDMLSIQYEYNHISKEIIIQWLIWMCGATPLAVYVQTRPRPQQPPLMIWITTSPWQRREMGPYGYYLNRPLSSLHSQINLSVQQQVYKMRRAYSDSKIIIKEPVKKKRYSKSV